MNKRVAFLFILALMSAYIFEVKPVFASSNPWVAKASMQVARASLGVAVVNGQIFAIGGVTDPPSWVQCTNTNEKYDPATDRWIFKASMPTPRASFGIAVYKNKIYCIGGTTGVKNAQQMVSGVNEVYDPATDKWETRASMPTARVGVTANVVDGKIYLLGGNSDANEVYDPETDSWTTKASIPVKPDLRLIWSCTSAVVDGKIYVLGAFPFVNSNQVYDPKTDSWSTKAPMLQGYYLASSGATTGNNSPKQIYVFGVDSTWWDLGPPNFTSLAYDPVKGSWRVFALMPTPRVNGAVGVVSDLIYVIGGSIVMIENNAHPTTVNEQYTPNKDQVIDNQVPTVKILSPENKTYSTNFQLNFSVNKPVAVVRYSMDQNIFTIRGNSTLSLPFGSHNLTVYAIDTYGNIGASETINFSVNANPQPYPVLFIALAVLVLGSCVVVSALHLRKLRKNALVVR